MSRRSRPIIWRWGTKVEAVGFPAKGGYTPKLEDAVVRKVSGGAAAAATIVGDEALTGNYDSKLVRLEATLLERTSQGHGRFLIFEADGVLFNAYLEKL